MAQYIPQLYPVGGVGNPLQYRMPAIGGMPGGGGSADYFARGQAMLGQAAQTMGQMDKQKTQTTTTEYEAPPMGVMDYLDAGVGYGLAGMKAYDMYQGWGKDAATKSPGASRIADMIEGGVGGAGGNYAGSGAGLFDRIGSPYSSPSGGTAIPTASRALTQTPVGAGSTMMGAGTGGMGVSTAGITGSSATAMGGRGAHEMLRGGVSASGASTAGAAGNAASMAGKMLPVAGAGLSAYGAFSQGAADRQNGGKNVGGFAQSAGSGALSGAMVGSAFPVIGNAVGAIVGGIGGGVLYLLG